MENVRDNEYLTKDLGEVAALLTQGFKIKSIQWKDKIAYFVFLDPVGCVKTANEYYFNNLPVSARQYFENLRLVKRKIYAEELKGGRKHV